jgi:hypothetical protein
MYCGNYLASARGKLMDDKFSSSNTTTTTSGYEYNWLSQRLLVLLMSII